MVGSTEAVNFCVRKGILDAKPARAMRLYERMRNPHDELVLVCDADMSRTWCRFLTSAFGKLDLLPGRLGNDCRHVHMVRSTVCLSRGDLEDSRTCAQIEAPQVVEELSVGLPTKDVNLRSDHDDRVSDAPFGCGAAHGDTGPFPGCCWSGSSARFPQNVTSPTDRG